MRNRFTNKNVYLLSTKQKQITRLLLSMSLLFAAIVLPCIAQKESVETVSIPTREQVGAINLPETVKPINAPFSMPQLKKPLFKDFTVSIISKGVNENTKVTYEIQQCIDEVSSRGGGIVLIPKGKWQTGRISLKSNVNLHFEEGAELYFSGDIEDYLPAVFTRNEGIELMSLGACIYANWQENIAITGKGRLIGPAKNGSVMKQVMDSTVIEKFVPLDKSVSERVYEGRNGRPIFLPMFISPTNCKNILIEGVTLENTAFWNIVPVYCDGVIIRGVTVNSVGIPRGDGIDIESSCNVLIEYCTLNNGDDCFTIKAGRGEDGVRVNKPSENIVIRYCLAKQGHGGVTMGSETAAMIRNVYVHDCVFDGTRVGLRFKTRRNRGGGGENLYYNRIRMNVTGAAFLVDMLGEAKYVGELAKRLPALNITKLTPSFKNITVSNIIVEQSGRFVQVNAIPETPLNNVLIENATVKSGKLFSAADVDSFIIRNTTIESNDSIIILVNTRNICFDNVRFDLPGKNIQLKLSEASPTDVDFVNCIPTIINGWKKQ